MCYEGDVFIKDIPNSIKRNDVIKLAAQVLGKINLNNVEYALNPNELINEEYHKVLHSDLTKIVEYQNCK